MLPPNAEATLEIDRLRAENERLWAENDGWRRLYLQSQEALLRLTDIAEKLAQG